MTDLHKLVAEKFKSGNSIEVERITITRKEYEAVLAQPEFDTPESHIVKWSIPVDPNNFGEPITFMGQYVGEGKVVSASFGLPKGAFEFAPYTGKGEASKIKHSLEPQPEQEELIQFKDGKWSYVRKPWVGLTQEERDELLNGSTRIPSRLIDWVEQKLKEKNGAL